EGLVFGARAARAAIDYAAQRGGEATLWELEGATARSLVEQSVEHVLECPDTHGAIASRDASREALRNASSEAHVELARAADAWLGIERDASGLRDMRRLARATAQSRASAEATLVDMIAQCALAREES